MVMFRDQLCKRIDDVKTPSVVFVDFLWKMRKGWFKEGGGETLRQLTFSANSFKQLVSESATSAKFVADSVSLMEASKRLDILRSCSSSLFYK